MIRAIVLQLAALALARAGLSSGQAQLALTGLEALVLELESVDPAAIGKWLAALPKPADNGNPFDDAGQRPGGTA